MLLLAFTSVARAGDYGFVVPAWPYPGNPVSHGPAVPPPDPATPLRLPGSEQSFTRAQVTDLFAAPDWYPGRHPTMPSIVAYGRKPAVYACAYCHLPDGQGRPENAALAGRSPTCIVRPLLAFRTGSRSAAAGASMMPVVAQMSVDDMIAAAAYAASLEP